jgi:RHS repeat-associated protein
MPGAILHFDLCYSSFGSTCLNILCNKLAHLVERNDAISSMRRSSLQACQHGGAWVSPYINRFLQPDSIIPNPANPQNWNRISYVGNNPIRFSDPTGHCRMDANPDDCFTPGKKYTPSDFLDLSGYTTWERKLLKDLYDKGGDVARQSVDFIVSHDVHLFVEDYGKNTGAKWTTDNNIVINSHGSDFTLLNGILTSKYYESIAGLIAHEAKHLEQGWIVALSVYGEFEGWKVEQQVKNEMFGTVPRFGTTRYVVFNTPLTHDPDTLGWVWRAMVGEQGWDYMVWLLPLNPLNHDGGCGGGIWCPAILSGH